MQLTYEQVQQLLHGNAEVDEWHSQLAYLLPAYNIDTPARIAGFIAQCGHESLNFTVLEENLNYSAEGLNKIFPKYFARAGRDAQQYHRKPERIANVVYSERMGNGSPDSGDGWRYRGRGVIQLTGKNNYAQFAAAIGKTLSETVEYLSTKRGALESACWYWTRRDINSACDANDLVRMTKLVNGGTIGLSDRAHHYERALAILGGKSYNTERPVLLRLGSTGDKVSAIQKVLGLEADGHFGKWTEAAVMAWQGNNGLVPDGVVGPKTFEAMLG